MTTVTPDFKTLFESVPGLYLILDKDGVIITASDDYLNAIASSRSSITGKKIQNIFGEKASAITSSFERSLRSRNADALAKDSYIIATSSGSSINLSGIISHKPIVNEQGEIDFIIQHISKEESIDHSALAKSEAKYRTLVEEAVDAILIYSPVSSKYLEANKKATELLGYTAEEITTLNVNDLTFHNRDQPRFTELEAGKTTQREVMLKRKDGSVVYVESTARKLPDGNYLAFVKDISEKKKAEAKINESEQKYKLLFESNPLPMWMLHMPDYNTVEVNNAALVQYGYTKEEFLKLDIFTLRPEEDLPRHRNTGKIFRGIYHAGVWRHMKKNGSVIYVEVITHDLIYEGAPTRLVLANEITEKYLAEEKLKQSYDSIRQLTAHLQDVREEERTHIAREIHDELGQLLTVLKMDVSWLNKRVGGTSAAVQDKMNELLKMIDLTVKTVRRIASELRPSLIDDLGLAAAMEWFIDDFEKRSGIQKEIYISGVMPELPDAMKIGIFRIFQESLTNVARHSEGDKVIVRLQHTENHLILTITDNGKGFDEKKANKKTLGLLGMKERTLMMGGEYNIKGRAGEGTTVTVIIPVENNFQ